MFYKKKGITLITLIVTIIVLLILAVVTLNVVIGPDDMMETVKESKTLSRIEMAREIIDDWKRTNIIKQMKGETEETFARLVEILEEKNIIIGEDIVDHSNQTITIGGEILDCKY